tara:strand:+ start:556 stop:1071 length:516 start_codon:yes stop_codon:yes gene_type:complete
LKIPKILPTLLTRRLRLRPMELIDSKQIVLWRNKEHIISNTIQKKKIQLDNHKDWFIRSRRNRIDYIIEILNKQKMIGVVSFKLLEIKPKLFHGELGKYIGEEDEMGKGFAIEATRKWIKFGFEYMNFHQIFSITKKTNIVNIHLNKKLGFIIDKSYGFNNDFLKMYISKQ